jgi:hypothetical protein
MVLIKVRVLELNLTTPKDLRLAAQGARTHRAHGRQSSTVSLPPPVLTSSHPHLCASPQVPRLQAHAPDEGLLRGHGTHVAHRVRESAARCVRAFTLRLRGLGVGRLGLTMFLSDRPRERDHVRAAVRPARDENRKRHPHPRGGACSTQLLGESSAEGGASSSQSSPRALKAPSGEVPGRPIVSLRLCVGYGASYALPQHCVGITTDGAHGNRMYGRWT